MDLDQLFESRVNSCLANSNLAKGKSLEFDNKDGHIVGVWTVYIKI